EGGRRIQPLARGGAEERGRRPAGCGARGAGRKVTRERLDAHLRVCVDAQVMLRPLDAEAYEKLHAYLRPAMGCRPGSAVPGEHEVDLLVDVRRDRGPCVAGEVLGSVAESGNCGDGGLLGLALPVGVLQVAEVRVDLGGDGVDVAGYHWLQAFQPRGVDLN